MNIHLIFTIVGAVLFGILFNLALSGGGNTIQALGEAVVYTFFIIPVPWLIAWKIVLKRGKRKGIDN